MYFTKRFLSKIVHNKDAIDAYIKPRKTVLRKKDQNIDASAPAPKPLLNTIPISSKFTRPNVRCVQCIASAINNIRNKYKSVIKNFFTVFIKYPLFIICRILDLII